jgi:hypothetical protein
MLEGLGKGAGSRFCIGLLVFLYSLSKIVDLLFLVL